MARGVSQSGNAKPVRVVRLPHAQNLPLPAYQTLGAAGLDLVAAVPAKAPIKLKKGARVLIPTGLIFELPAGYEAQVRPRSGLALKHGITVLNSPGTIDSDYRGEIQVILVNLGEKTFVIQRGERIAQMVIAPVTQMTLQETASAQSTARGAGGFGSTGVVTPKMATRNISKLNASKPEKAAKPLKTKGKSKSQSSKSAPKRVVAVPFPRRALRGLQHGAARTRRR